MFVNNNKEKWDVEITPEVRQTYFNIKELWNYRDLLLLFVKRDIITVYKQTVLGPIWFVIQPVLTTVIYYFIFDRMANIGTDSVPSILFYLGSITIWNYFQDTLNITSKTFTDNASIFGKVYFPRLIIPLSKVISGFVKLLIQFSLFIAFWIYYSLCTNKISPNAYALLLPFIFLLMMFLSLGFGLLITSMTTKYRDLTFLISFGVQLLMYATPVIYPLSKYPDYQSILFLNPLTSIFELFKYGFYGKGVLAPFWIAYSVSFTFFIMFIGILFFNKVEKRFIDTV